MKNIVVLSLFYCVFLQGQVSYNQEFKVNTRTIYNRVPQVSTFGDSSFIICWDSEDGILGQIFNTDGSRIGSEIHISTDKTHSKFFSTVSSLEGGGFVVCWESLDQDSSDWGIYGQIFNSTGSKYGNEFRVNTFTNNSQRYPGISSLSNGDFVVCWGSRSQDGSSYGIYGQIFKNDGTKLGDEFQVNTYTFNMQNYPSVNSLNNGGFIVCWQSAGQSVDDDIYGQLYDRTGSKHGAEFRINTYTPSYQVYPSVHSLRNGGFVVCWQSDQDGSADGIYGQIFNDTGTKFGNEFRVNTYTNSIQAVPSVSSLLDEGFIVCWDSDQDASGYGIYGQIFNDDGTKHGSEFRINTSTTFDQRSSSVCSLTNRGFVVCWDTDTGIRSGIYAKYYIHEINHQLIPFSLLELAQDVTTKNVSPTLKWYQASSLRINLPWELEYTIYLDENDNFSSPIIIECIYDTTYTVQNLTPGTTYFWKVLAKNIAGDSLWSSETNVFFISHDATGIKHQTTNTKFQTFELYANYPNPFNPETTVKYNLPADQSVYPVKVKIYDALGRLISTLKNEQQNTGLHTVKWNGKNSPGQNMPSGIYFCVVEAGQFRAAQKMLLVR